MSYPFAPQNLAALLRQRAEQDPALPLFRSLAARDGSAVRTPAQLSERAQAIAGALQVRGMAGARVILLFPPGLDFIDAFFGCVLAGVVPAPAPMPQAHRLARTLPRLRGMIEDARPAAILTLPEGLAFAAEVGGPPWLSLDPADAAAPFAGPDPHPDAPAHLQYTSGSTSRPKGTVITHRNILANSASIQRAWGFDRDSRSVVWVPHFHDDGLVQGLIQPLFTGFPCLLLPAADFVGRPARWLQAISDSRATHSGGPNFAYDLCVRKVTDAERAGLDLSTWRFAYNAAEPVRPATLRDFAARFAPVGFRAPAMAPCFGLAEATLLVSGGQRPAGPTLLAVDAATLDRDGQVVIVDEAAPGARLWVGCGTPAPGAVLFIIDPTTHAPQPEGRLGEVIVGGPSIAAGYLDRPRETAETFGLTLPGVDGPLLRTGDQGFVWEGELYITGRLKELIIVRGENRYPHDIEATVAACHPALVAGGAAAFSVEVDGQEGLGLLAEVRLPDGDPALHAVVAALRAAVSEAHDLAIDRLGLLPPGQLPKTSSGKIMRRAAAQALAAGAVPLLSLPASPADRRPRGELVAWVLARLQHLLQRPGEAIDPDQPLAALGIDSVAGVQLIAELSAHIGREIPATTLWAHPTVHRLVAHVRGEDAPPARAALSGTPSDLEPIAIIGVGCRLPGGVDDLASLTALLQSGVDAVGPLPEDRFDARARAAFGSVPGGAFGGFLPAVDGFEPGFFSLSPREAAAMDPQQRLLLEVTTEALESAGLPRQGLLGRDGGVYVGISSQEYAGLGQRARGGLDPHLYLGTAHSTGVGRLSYWLGLTGPNVAVDTACSSSLVAIHLAVSALRAGECSFAIAGGVNLILDPETTRCLGQLRALSPTGRCHTFRDAADGYVRAEGCGLIVCKRLSDAQRDGDRVLALIHGSAINQDGRSNGLTAPHGPAQEAVIHRALAQAGLQPDRVDLIEAHGTGTPIGDPIEMSALQAVFGGARADGAPLWVGAFKAQVGHLEAAAGVAGLLKVVAALGAEQIPALPQDGPINPRIDLSPGPLRLPAAPQPWRRGPRPRFAGVSSFGLSGTNAHIVLGEAPAPLPSRAVDGTPALLPLSAPDLPALRRRAAQVAAFIEGPSAPPLADLSFTAARRRDHGPERLALIASPTLAADLRAFADGGPPIAGAHGRAKGEAPPLVLVFGGQGAQWPGMATDLLDVEPAFTEALDAVARALAPHVSFSLRAELARPPEQSRLAETAVAQPALFAVQVALAAQLQAWGLVPQAVVGHSVGEIAAAHVAGLLTLDAAARLVALRGEIMAAAHGGGAMVAVDRGEAWVKAALARLPLPTGLPVELAAVNDPGQVVCSGPVAAIEALVQALQAEGVEHRRLPVDYAFHSAQMEPLRRALEAALGDLPSPAKGQLPLFSTVSAQAIESTPGAAYWGQNLRQTVRFADAIASALRFAPGAVFVEVSPHPALSVNLSRCLQGTGAPAIPTLRRQRPGPPLLRAALAAAWVAGLPLRWDTIQVGGALVPLPPAPFQRQRCWITAAPPPDDGHPLKGPALRSSLDPDVTIFSREISPERPAFLGDHRVDAVVVWPGAATLELARAACAELLGVPASLHEVELLAMLRLDGPRQVELILREEGPQGAQFILRSAPKNGRQWVTHATGRAAPAPSPQVPRLDLRPRFGPDARAQAQALRGRLSQAGLTYGEAFQGLEALTREDDAAIGQITPPPSLVAWTEGLHPALLDAALQVAGGLLPEDPHRRWIPVGVRAYWQAGDPAFARARRGARQGDVLVDIDLFDPAGLCVGQVLGLALRSQGMTAPQALTWTLVEVDAASTLPPGDWAIVGAPGPQRDRFAAALSAQGARLRTVGPATEAANLIFLGGSPAGGALPLLAEALALAQARQGRPGRLWFVTVGALGTGRPESLIQAPLWGLARALQLEQPSLGLTCVDLDPDELADVWDCAALLGIDPAEGQLCLRDAVPQALRLRPTALPDARAPLTTAGWTLVTGAFGGLGLSLAAQLVAAGQERLALLGRRPPGPEAQAAIAAMRANGAVVELLCADVADRAALAAALAPLRATGIPLTGVLHLAGVLRDAPFTALDPGALAAAWAPKAQGAENLHALTLGDPLQRFVLYASAAGLLGSPGQGAYAAANAYLDALAQLRQNQGLPALSVQWGPFGEAGMAAQRPGVLARLGRLGIRPLHPEEAGAALGALLATSLPTASVLRLDAAAWVAAFPGTQRLLAGLLAPAPRAPVASKPDAPLEERLRAELAAVLRLDPRAIPAEASLLSLGVDSLLAVELRGRIEARFGRTIPATELLKVHRLDELVQRLRDTPAASVLAPPAKIPPAPPRADGRLELSPAQLRLWFLDRMHPGTALYNMELSLDLEGPLDAGLLEQAVALLFERHELLRATFAEVDGHPTMQLGAAPTRPLERVDLDAADAEAAFAAAAQARAGTPFHLEQGPLARATLFRLHAAHHRLQWVFHHIIADAWSLVVLLDGLAQAYRALRDGRPPQLPPLPIRYGDVAAALIAHQATPAYAASLAHWKERLAGLPRLNLPGRPSHLPLRPIGASLPFSIDADRLRRLEAVASEAGATLFVALIAVYAGLLQRVSGQDDLPIGTVSAGRPHADTRGLVGFFVSTLVLRCDLRGAPSFLELIARLRAVVDEALEHEEVPFDAVVRACGAARGPDLNPLYQASFTLESVPMPALDGVGGRWTPMTGRLDGSVEGTAKNELNLTLRKGPAGLLGSLEYATDRLTAAQATQLLGQFQTLLDAFLDAPKAPISAAPMAPADEGARLLAWGIGDPAPAFAEATVHARIGAIAEAHPEAIAIEQGDTQLSYRDLWERSAALAGNLVARGVGPEVPVGLVADRSPSTLIGYLAILRAGGACLPFDPTAPPARNAQIVEEAGLRLLLAPARLAGQAPPAGVQWLPIEGPWSPLPFQPETGPDRAAYLIFTSGSTGRPKGVVVEHRQVLALLGAVATSSKRFGVGSRVLHRTPLTVDVAVLETLIPLCLGRTIVVAPGDTARSPAALASLIRQTAVTYVDLPPALLGPLLDEPDFLAASSLQIVSVGGDRLEPALQARFVGLCPATLLNNYGPTEATVEVTSWEAPRQPAPISIGRPLPGCRVYVCDPSGALCSPGVPGELWIGGPTVARGYWGRPEETAARFGPDPFGEGPSARVYRTGDRVAWNDAGQLDFLGRVDHQVKLRGHRIELGEIEAAILLHPHAAIAAVLLREDRPGHPQLVAYVQPGDFQLTAARLREHLRARLPAPMVPSLIVMESALPLLPSGKVDRNALPAPALHRDGEVGEHTPPRTETETIVSGIWEGLLDIRPIGVHDEFFAVGGHSLLAILLSSALEKRFGQPFPLARVLELRTIAEQADAIDRPRLAGADDARTPLYVLRAQGTRPPLFLMQPTASTVFCYADLARELGPDQPVYGLQESSVEGATRHLDSIESLAARYLAAVRTVVPQGPVHLGGWSFGGTVAFEMARQLEQSGDPAAMVLIIDAAIPGSLVLAEPDLPSAQFILVARYLQLQGILADVAPFRAMEPSELLPQLADVVERAGWFAPGRGEAFISGLAGTIYAHWEALARYRPSPLHTALEIIRAAEQPKRLTGFLGASWDWSPYALGSIVNSSSAGQHGNMIYTPNALSLARLIRRRMDGAPG